MGKQIAAYPIPTVCEFCDAKVIYTANAKIYGRVLGNGRCYKCTRCDAYVSVHTGTNIPMGRLANGELRELKIRCHKLFDKAWKGSGKRIKRDEAYKRLAGLLKIPHNECHFGWFDKVMLLKSLQVLDKPNWHTYEN